MNNCCVCLKQKKCFTKQHPKIKQINTLYHKVIGNVPNEHKSMIFCAECGQQIFDELSNEYNTKILHAQKKIQKDSSKSDTNALNEFSVHSMSVTLLEETDKWFQIISKRFHESLPNKIIRIEKVINLKLEQQFEEHNNEVKESEIHYLFHGSQNQNYDSILKNGFKLEFAKASGALGAGIYFAKNASYSHTYTQDILTKEKGTIKNMLCSKVILNKNAVSGGGDIWAVFSESQCCPAYIIYYLT